jgi:lycopene beta-cyclase
MARRRGRILAGVTEVLVVGGGPAGRALAAECGARGLTTTLVDPAPHAPWRATYGAWLDELPAHLPPPAATARGRVVAVTSHDLDRTYAVLDVPALRDHLDARLAAAGVRIVTGRVVGIARGGRAVLLADGTRLDADVLVDAGGHRAPLGNHVDRRRAPHGVEADHHPRPHGNETDHHSGRHGDEACVRRAPCGDHADPLADEAGRRGSGAADLGLTALAGGRRARVAAEQTAYGVVVDAATAAPLVGPGEALFMDWRPDHGEPGWPTFLYAIPLGGGAVLLEETSLARRPGLPLPVLHRRLDARLARHGITAPPDARVERVRFPVDQPRHTTPGVLAFGAAAPLMHPATGFSVADALRLAPVVAGALATGGVPAAQRRVWPARALAVHRLRRIGLEALLRMPPDTVPGFFETFFALPARHRRAYLSDRDDLAGHLAAMGALFSHADVRLRRRLIDPAFRGPAPALPR